MDVCTCPFSTPGGGSSKRWTKNNRSFILKPCHFPHRCHYSIHFSDLSALCMCGANQAGHRNVKKVICFLSLCLPITYFLFLNTNADRHDLLVWKSCKYRMLVWLAVSFRPSDVLKCKIFGLSWHWFVDFMLACCGSKIPALFRSSVICVVSGAESLRGQTHARSHLSGYISSKDDWRNKVIRISHWSKCGRWENVCPDVRVHLSWAHLLSLYQYR